MSNNQQLVSEIEAVKSNTAKTIMLELLNRSKEALEAKAVTVDLTAEVDAALLKKSIEKADDLTSSELGVLLAQGQQKVVSGFEAIGKLLLEAGEDYKKLVFARDAVKSEIENLTKTKAELLTLQQVVNARIIAEAEKKEVLAKLDGDIEATKKLIDDMKDIANSEIEQLKADAKKERDRVEAEFKAQHEFDKKQAKLSLKDELDDMRRAEQVKIDNEKAKLKAESEALDKREKEMGDTVKRIQDLEQKIIDLQEYQTKAIINAVEAKEEELKKEFKYEKDLLIQQKANEIVVLTRENEMQAEIIEDLKLQIKKLEQSQANAYSNVQAMATKVAEAAGSQKVNVNVPSAGSSEANKR